MKLETKRKSKLRLNKKPIQHKFDQMGLSWYHRRCWWPPHLAMGLDSGDQDLLALGEYEGVQVVTPRQFTEILASLRAQVKGEANTP
jgi:hypothetical protein